MKIILSFMCSAIVNLSLAQRSLPQINSELAAVWQARNYQRYITVSEEYLAISPHPAVMLRRATSYIAVGKTKEGIKLLKHLTRKGLTYRIDTVKILLEKLNENELNSLNQAFQRNYNADDRSDTAFVVDDKTLIPEGIASAVDGKFYIGSLAQWKITVKSVKGGATDFVPHGQGGLWSVLGLKVYEPARELWACSASEVDSINGYSALLCFDIQSGFLKKRFVVDNKVKNHFFNDLAIDSTGNIYLTDSKSGALFYYDRSKDELKELLSGFIFPNGITLDDKNEKLYVADARGLHVIIPSTLDQKLILDRGKTFTVGIDGLYFYKGNLLAIQDTGLLDDRVVQFHLKNDVIQGTTILQHMRKDFFIPTTGTIHQGFFYYIANSHLRNLKPDMQLVQIDALTQPVVLKIKLDQ